MLLQEKRTEMPDDPCLKVGADPTIVEMGAARARVRVSNSCLRAAANSPDIPQ